MAETTMTPAADVEPAATARRQPRSPGEVSEAARLQSLRPEAERAESAPAPRTELWPALAALRRWRVPWGWLGEWVVLLLVAFLYASPGTLDFSRTSLQQTGEHNESATLPVLAEIGRRYGEIPLWNPYMRTGFPHAGDFINHYWNPVSTIPVLIWGGIVGMKVSIFISFVVAGLGQWVLAHQFGLRGMFRLWAAAMFVVSGGLAVLWRLGWYELLVGMAWFPWVYAGLWWSLRRRDLTSIVLTALGVAMIITAGGGYYPFYLAGTGLVLLVVSLLMARRGERLPQLRRAAAIGLFSGALCAVVLLPWIDGWRFTAREAGPDMQQQGSQPIPYALLNYVIQQPEWYRATILGTASGFNWFYIGAFPIFAALAFGPLALTHPRYRRWLIPILAVTVFILAWHANRHSFMFQIYELVPFLYTFRFPGRLLILATIPLLILTALGLQYVFCALRRWGRAYRIEIVPARGAPLILSVLPALVTIVMAGLLFWSARDAYTVNRGFGFVPGQIDPRIESTLRWIKEQDPDLYYINIGGGAIWWGWTAVAYELEQPVINFKYNRDVVTFDQQRRPGAPFFAMPKYQISAADQPKPANAQLIRPSEGGGVYYFPDSLPYAFSTPVGLLASGQPVTKSQVMAQPARLTPNRVIVTGTAGEGEVEMLVVLMSHYPGWQVLVDGAPAALQVINDYLAVAMAPGTHTYTFEFQPRQHTFGLIVSLVALVAAAGLLVLDLPFVRARFRPVLTLLFRRR